MLLIICLLAYQIAALVQQPFMQHLRLAYPNRTHKTQKAHDAKNHTATEPDGGSSLILAPIPGLVRGNTPIGVKMHVI